MYELYDSKGVFYVGKGSGERIRITQRTGSKPKVARARSGRARIVAYFRLESDALAHERERITWYDGLTNIAHVSKARTAESYKEWADELWSHVYLNVDYRSPERKQFFKIAKLCYEKLSTEIRCLEAESARVLADQLECVTRKLLRGSKPLPNQEIHRSITCYQ